MDYYYYYFRTLRTLQLRMLDSTRRLAAISAHASSVIVPILGPMIVLLVASGDKFVRQHSTVAVLASVVTMAVTAAGSELFGGGPVFFLLPLFGLVIVATTNIQRVKLNEGPLFLRADRASR